ncbi:MAG: TlpA family protein disulfide reductase [Candidatus Coatesbacteria bacterium]|nr:MAG: TlpA family protein disulfide reductase [Candidatus Coatesbacteria bacterium]
MKSVITFAVAAAVLLGAPAWAAKTMPPFNLKNVDGQKMNFAKYAEKYELMAFVFWATGCAPCKDELVEINKFADDYEGFGVVAVSTDSARTSSLVKPYFKGQGFKFDTLLDVDGELVKALGVPGNPFSLLVTAAGDIIWEHSGYRKGDERKIKEEIEKYFAAAGEAETAEEPAAEEE